MRTVFISYRRKDSEGQARALKNTLVELVGEDSVFLDVDDIALGQDYRQVLQERLESCDLLLALIGPGWLDAKDGAGSRRLESDTDLVRHEIATALKRNIPVVPVLLQGAQMPAPERLPDEIKELGFRNAFGVDHSTWEPDVREMVRRLGLGSAGGTRSFNTAWLLGSFAVVAIVAALFFFTRVADPGPQARPGENGPVVPLSGEANARGGSPAADNPDAAKADASGLTPPKAGPPPSAKPDASKGGKAESPPPDKPPGSPAPGVVSRVLSGGSGAANSVSVSPDSHRVAAGYQTGVVKVWDPTTGKTVASLPGQIGSVSAVAFSPDNRLLAITSGDRTVRLWDLGQEKESARLVGHRESVLAVAFSPNGRTVATASADATVRLWDAATGEGRTVFTGHTDWGTSVAFSDDGNYVISGSRDRSVRVWDVQRSRERMTIDVSGGVWSVAIAPNGNLVAAGTDDGTVVVCDADTGELKWSTAAHKGTVWALSFNGKGTQLATGGADSLVKLWDTTSSKALQTFRGHSEWVRSVVFEPAGTWLASASGDGDVRLWSTR